MVVRPVLRVATYCRHFQRGQRHTGTRSNRVYELISTMSLPGGTSETGMNLELNSVSGIPTIVTAVVAALSRCPIVNHNLNGSTQMVLLTRAPVPAPGLLTIVWSNGRNAYDAMLRAVKPADNCCA